MFDVELAQKFLIRNYDPKLELIRASPSVEKLNYYHYNDNYLASLALRDYSYLTHVLAATIQGSPYTRMVVLDGIPFDVTWQQETVTIATLEEKQIKTERQNVTLPPLSVDEYADIAALNVIQQANLGLMKAAEDAYLEGMVHFFDGTAIKDTHDAEGYEVYKSCLFILAAQRISTLDARIKALQLFTDNLQDLTENGLTQGGVFTNSVGAAGNSDANAETTALKILAARYQMRYQ